MNNFCSNCGNKLEQNEIFCHNCGKQNNLNVQNNKIPGNGVSIAGMILGIIAVSWYLISINVFIDFIKFIYNPSHMSFNQFMGFLYIMVYTTTSLVISLVGLPLSIVGCVKHKSAKNITGIILNSLALIASIAITIIIQSH